MTLSDILGIKQSLAEIERLSLESERIMSCHLQPALRAELRRLWVLVQETSINEPPPPDEE